MRRDGVAAVCELGAEQLGELVVGELGLLQADDVRLPLVEPRQQPRQPLLDRVDVPRRDAHGGTVPATAGRRLRHGDVEMMPKWCHTDAMNLTPYVENLHRQLAVAADAGGEDARALAERLTAPLESATRLMLLDALSAAADEITRELAPGSVELRLRSGEPDFVVTPAPADEPLEQETSARAPAPPELDEGAAARINLRLPEQLKAGVEHAAGRERLSVNAWLVRVVAAAVAHDERPPGPRGGRVGQAYTGWVR